MNQSPPSEHDQLAWFAEQYPKLETALRMACREIAEERALEGYEPDVSEADIDDVVAEFLSKARGFEGATP